MAIDISAQPYFDDYNVNDKYYKILFKPGYAVQARELTQLQTIIQKQIETFGKNVFKEGSMVIPGGISVDTNVGYVKLQGNNDLSLLIGSTLTGSTSGISATVLSFANSTVTDAPTLFIKYLGSATDTVTKTFQANEVLLNSNLLQIGTTLATSPTGFSSIASIANGFYFVRNLFVQVTAQTIILDKYSNTPSYKVGLDIIESIETADTIDALSDPAQGTPNFSAPGADRYKISLNLNKKNADSTSDETTFIQLLIIKSGIVQQKVTTTDYSIIEQTLARRTYDESGDYTVRSFPIDVREFRNNFRGSWTASTNYIANDIVSNNGNFYRARQDGTSNSTAPVQTVGSTTTVTSGLVWTYEKSPVFNRGINNVVLGETLATQNLNNSKFSIGLEPGKAYVKGYEIEKISTEYIPVNKARDTTQVTNVKVPATVGNYIIINNINSLPNVTTFPLINLYNQFTTTSGVASGVLVGTARVKYVEFNNDTVQGTQTTKYKLALFAVTMLPGFNFNIDVKQVFLAGGSATTSFSADVFPVQTQINGSVSAAASTTLSGIASLFLSQLRVGDYIIVAGNRRRITTVSSNTSIIVDSALTVSGELVFLVSTVLLEPEKNPLFYPLTFPYVKSVRDSSNNNNTTYSVTNFYNQTSVTSGSNTTITLASAGSDTFGSPSIPSNYLILDNVTGLVVVPVLIVYGSTTQQIIITISTATIKSYSINATLNRIGSANEKVKSLSTTTTIFTAKNTVTASSIQLNKADGFRILQILMDTGTFAAPTGVYTNDITDRYSFFDGQRESFYDLAVLNLIQGKSVPIAPIQVTFEYFDHSGTGDYFTVNSYLSTISYDEIPTYVGIPLAYVYDFRPRINDTGTAFSSLSLLPKRGVDIQSDFQYYLSRKDKVALNQTGKFFSISGTSSLIPSDPIDSSTGMILYKLSYNPYGYTTGSIDIITIDNKRYTMRDIGKLEKRIDNIEYYTSLSMLEQDAQSLQIIDKTGLSRFKNGFIVDNFTGHNIGNVASTDYKCAIDMELGQMRPTYYMDNINLIESNTTSAQRATNGYQVTGDLITLPYTETELAKQLSASRVENVNPFAIFTFIGSTELNPPSDEWFEVNRLPDIITNVEGNFNAVYTASELSGALNPIWNAWQTQWTGTTTTDKTTFIELQSNTNVNYAKSIGVDFKNAPHKGKVGRRLITDETSITTSGQSRTGVRAVIVPKIDTQVTNDRTLSKAVIPYIRARSLLFVVRGLKPSTKFTAFFDSVDVSLFTTPSTTLSINKNGNFNNLAMAGGDSSESARFIGGNAQSCLDKGDIVFVQQRGATIYTKLTSPATAVLALVSDVANTTNTALGVVNIIGTFQVGDTVVGSISGAVSTINATPVISTIGQSLTSNVNGDVVGLFAIPNTDSNRFRTGVREFKLSDDATDSPARTSFARKQYRAEGIVETKQASVTATRNADLRQESVADSRTVVQQSTRIISDSGWYDPIAQTFLVQSKGGAFVTSIDIFFATKDINLPVRMQIREVVNGYPGKVIIPFSEKLLSPDKVNIATTLVQTTQGDMQYAPTVATKFSFPSPVYLNDSTEYCVVLLSDSNNYRVWISQLGEKSVISGTVISEQPYAGVLFKSQNASTWTANQDQDLMFRINQANFTTNQYAEVDFVNSELSKVNLIENPINIVAGINYVRINHNNHGLFIGQIVTLSGVTTSGGIPLAQLNTNLAIVFVELDSYIVQVTTNATFTGSFGGTTVMASRYVQYNTVQPIIQQQVFAETDISHTMRSTSGKSINGFESPFVLSNSYPISINENNKLPLINLVGNTVAETTFNAGNKSIKLHSRFITTNANISPVIDIARLSLITVLDRINSPSNANTNFPAIDVRSIVTNNNLIAITGNNTLMTSDATTMAAFLTINVGSYITLAGFANGSNNGQFLVTSIAPDGTLITLGTLLLVAVSVGTSVSLTVLDRFIDEIAPIGSSSVAKYVSKRINLANPSTFIKVKFAADVSELANIDIYYKLKPVSSTVNFNLIPYIKAAATLSAVKSNNGKFSDVQYDIPNLTIYDGIQVKLVLNSVATSNIVRIKDLSIICCA